MKKLFFITLILLCLSINWANESFQTFFSKKEGISIVQLDYKWKGFNNINNSIIFNLDKSDLEKSYVDFKKPNKDDAFKYVLEFLKNDIEKINKSQNKYQIELEKNEINYSFVYKINGNITNKTNNDIISALKYRQQEHMKNFFKRNYFIWNQEKELVSIDYFRLSQVYIPKMNNIAEAFKIKNNKNIYNKRLVVNDILSFYQSIPYDTLKEDRGEGFSTPLKFLHENKGDCDTKLVAINATIKALYPEIKTIAIVLPNHVLLGISIEPNEKDRKININGITYVLAETAGPALIPAGIIDSKNEDIIKSRKYSIINI